ncbi:MAG: poly(3-hydroxybutyrate) depolymerase [Hyphomicrobiaceae bacterium]|nr:poly(3-hydroxybutyrate) depolymerase [Hyphomicrobiaceae bacterium]
MAGQFQLAHADIVIGAAIIAGGPFGCAESAIAGWLPGAAAAANLGRAVSVCMLGQMRAFGQPDAAQLAARARALAANGAIGRISDVASDRVYLFSGRSDAIVVDSVVAAAADFYRALGVPDKHLKVVLSIPAGHGFVAPGAKAACARNGSPYLVGCPYDQAGDLLSHLYGKLRPASAQHQGRFLVFDQAAFVPPNRESGLAREGFIYVPPACATAPGCRLHVSFHGCSQNVATIGRAFVTGSGLARRADTNRIVVLFPQVAVSVVNPQGCWDWWGYTGRDFLTRHAPQIAAVRAMLDRLAARH